MVDMLLFECASYFMYADVFVNILVVRVHHLFHLLVILVPLVYSLRLFVNLVFKLLIS